MKTYKSVTLAILFALTLNGAFAQDYKTGIGLRLGAPSGITFKHFYAQKSAIEGTLSFGWGGVGFTGLYELHNSIPDVRGLNWYYGAGAHLATADSHDDNPWDKDKGDDLFLGVDGVLGLEYTFAEAPICISLDFSPILNVIESPGVWFNAGISVRYTFR
ncbi:MAG: hypothetical protein AB7S54_06800 [Bacteroidales bacterium]